MKKPLFSYVLAGLDFLVDTEGNIAFLEANSNPDLIVAYKELYGEYAPLDRLVEALEGEKNILFIYTKEYVESEDYGYRYGKFKLKFGKACQQLIIPKDQLKDIKFPLKDYKGEIIDRATVWCSHFEVKKIFKENKKFRVLNPAEVVAVTLDKWETHQAVGHVRGMRLPKTFLFSTKQELVDLVAKQNLKKFVIKPRFGTEGKDIFIINNKKQLETLHLPQRKLLVQEKIEVQKDKSKFWCIRAFVVNGKYVGAMKLLSKDSVVNVSRGATTDKIEKALQKKLAPIAERCVQAIETYSKKRTAK